MFRTGEPCSSHARAIAVAAIVATLFVSSCRRESAPSDTSLNDPSPSTTTRGSAPPAKAVTVAYLPIIPDLPLFVAFEQRIFQKHGLEASPLKVTGSGNQVLETLARGDAQFAYLAFSTVLEAEAQSPGTFVTIHHNVDSKEFPGLYSLVARNGIDVKRVADLKNKKVATFPGSAMLVLTSLMLRSAGLEPGKDVVITQLAPPAQVAALKTSQVDALLALEPIGALAEHANAGRIVDRWPLTPSVADVIPTGASVMQRTVTERDPRLAEQLTAAIDEAIDYIRAHPEEVKQLYTKYCDVPPAVASKLPVLAYWKSGEVKREVAQAYADLLHREKSLATPVQVAGLYKKP